MIKAIAFIFPRSSYIVSPLFDWIAFIGAPLIALALGMAISYDLLPNINLDLAHYSGHIWGYIALLLTKSHLFITFIRAYGNPEIFSSFKTRFLLVPPILFAILYFSPMILAIIIAFNIWWDVYHSACQTYGFTRLYDIRVGNVSEKMRLLDRCLNVLIYVGPILGGITLIDHIRYMETSFSVGSIFFSSIPFYADLFAADILVFVLIFTVAFLAYYLVVAFQESKKYPLSFQKVFILIFTAIVSILAWGFNTFGAAFLIMNFFHLWQYYAMIYWTEKSVLKKRFNLDKNTASFFLMLLLVTFTLIVSFLSSVTIFERLLLSFFTMVATCHFWFDGFIWSVKKKHIN